LGRTGLEQPEETPTNTHISETGAAESAAFDAELQRIIALWPGLTADVKAAIAKLATG
jgi:hypothetical protein